MDSAQLASFTKNAILSMIAICLVFPLLIVYISGNIAYYLNVEFFSQKIFLIASIFIFLFFLVFRDRLSELGWKAPDTDDAVVFGVMALSLVLLLGFLHANFDTILRMHAFDVGRTSMSLGFGGFLTDSFDLARVDVGQDGITKIIDVDNLSAGSDDLMVHGGWQGNGNLSSTVLISVNGGNEMDVTRSFAALNSSDAGWIDIRVPPGTFRKGRNEVLFRSGGLDEVFLSSQWVYHDEKTLVSGGNYYGQEALVHLNAPPAVPPLFSEAFRYQLVIRLAALLLLFMSLFGFGMLRLAWDRFSGDILTIASLSIFAIIMITVVQNLWIHLSAVTAGMLPAPLGLVAKVYTDFQDPNGAVVGVRDFYIRISKSCSGIESIAIFALLFPVIAALNMKGEDRRLIPVFFAVGIVGAFLVNVLRLLLLMVVGGFVSSELALEFFHTNLSWMLMLGYFAVFNESVVRICRRER